MIDSFDDWRRGRKAKRLRNRVHKGVPDCVRGKVWQMLVGSTVSVLRIMFGARGIPLRITWREHAAPRVDLPSELVVLCRAIA